MEPTSHCQGYGVFENTLSDVALNWFLIRFIWWLNNDIVESVTTVYCEYFSFFFSSFWNIHVSQFGAQRSRGEISNTFFRAHMRLLKYHEAIKISLLKYLPPGMGVKFSLL